ncbi:hypothetical protein V512_007175 [Mesotoga sp. Brook.08.105.5.1]|nr:hypothetical protein V512_007175 [Mesotoga sp. Brook.08.105.5.1]RAO96874.1 hypothetical protein M388_12915 [Mesotoga sp. Brook.08.YT.4.2.5.4.]
MGALITQTYRDDRMRRFEGRLYGMTVFSCFRSFWRASGKDLHPLTM